jgi:hypothetical protein
MGSAGAAGCARLISAIAKAINLATPQARLRWCRGATTITQAVVCTAISDVESVASKRIASAQFAEMTSASGAAFVAVFPRRAQNPGSPHARTLMRRLDADRGNNPDPGIEHQSTSSKKIIDGQCAIRQRTQFCRRGQQTAHQSAGMKD